MRGGVAHRFAQLAVSVDGGGGNDYIDIGADEMGELIVAGYRFGTTEFLAVKANEFGHGNPLMDNKYLWYIGPPWYAGSGPNQAKNLAGIPQPKNFALPELRVYDWANYLSNYLNTAPTNYQLGLAAWPWYSGPASTTKTAGFIAWNLGTAQRTYPTVIPPTSPLDAFSADYLPTLADITQPRTASIPPGPCSGRPRPALRRGNFGSSTACRPRDRPR